MSLNFDVSKSNLDPFTLEETEELLRSYGGEQSISGHAEVIHGVTLGNPFFIGELIRDWNGSLLGFKNWPNENVIAGVPTHSALTILKERLAGLSEDERSLLELLHIAETPQSCEVVARVLQWTPESTDQVIRSLSEKGVVHLVGSLENLEVSFSHDWYAFAVRDLKSSKGTKEVELRLAEEILKFAPSDLTGRAAAARHLLRASSASRGLQLAKAMIPELINEGLTYEAALLSDEIIRGNLLDRHKPDWSLAKPILESYIQTGQYDKLSELCRKVLNSFSLPQEEEIEVRFLLLRALRDNIDYEESKNEAETAYLMRLPEINSQQYCERMHAHLLCGLTKSDIMLAKIYREIACEYLRAHNQVSPELILSLFSYDTIAGNFRETDTLVSSVLQDALSLGNLSLFLGRLQTYVVTLLCRKRLSRARQILDYSLPLACQGRDRGVEAFLLDAHGVCVGAGGHHREAVEFFRRLLDRQRQGIGVNTGFEVEILANQNWRMLPEEWPSNPKFLADPASNDVAARSCLAQLWSLLISGDPVAALKGCPPHADPFPRGYWRFRILQATSYHLMNQSKLAEEHTRQALQEIPSYQYNYRARVAYLRARIHLREGGAPAALKLVEEALAISKEHFYFPLIAEGHVLMARCLAALKGDLKRARAHCLRAHQTARDYQRPLLHATIWRFQAEIEARLGKPAAARMCYGKALLILKERLLHVDPKNREGFRKLHIEPIESERERWLGKSQETAAIFQRVPAAMESLQAARSQQELAEKFVEAARRPLPHLSLQLWLRRGESKPQELADGGKKEHSAKTLLRKYFGDQFPNEPGGFADPDNGSAAFLLLPISPDTQTLVYFESRTGELTEIELDFLTCLANIAEKCLSRLHPQPARLREGNGIDLPGGNRLIGRHPRMQQLFQHIHQIAPTTATVLIQGESGTGKELVARALHHLSTRAGGPFIALNCGAIPESLIENELFGHRRGSFTGAAADAAGLIEAAHGGTLFLDEISSMPPSLQTRLLRVLQERRVRRIGDSGEKPVNVRILAATNQPMQQLVEEGRFRTDLYYRLKVVELFVPPLRKRLGDVPLLAEFFLARLNREHQRQCRFSKTAMRNLRQHTFPGNVRELGNLVESAFHLAADDEIRELQPPEAAGARPNLAGNHSELQHMNLLFQKLKRGEARFWEDVRDPFLNRDLCRRELRYLVELALEDTSGNYRQVARLFGLPDQDYRKMLSFLSHHDCKLDFRPYRQRA